MKPQAWLAGTLAALALASTATAQSSAPAAAPSPEKLEAARHLMKTMHAEQIADQLIKTMESSFMGSMTQTAPGDAQQRARIFQQQMLEGMRGFMPQLFDDMATIYATDFTDEELADIDRFYSSPSGQAVLNKLPRVTQQILPLVMAQMPTVIGAAFDKTCEKVTCTAPQRAAVAKALEAMRARAAAMKPG